MADLMSYLTINGTTYEVADEAARAAVENFPITKIVSESADTAPVLRSLDSGSYVLQGKFRAYTGATGVLSFSSALMVNVIKATSKSSVQVFYPVNNCVQFLEITDEAMTRTNVYLNQVLEHIGTMDDLTTEDKTSLVAAINELVATVSSMSGGTTEEQTTFTEDECRAAFIAEMQAKSNALGATDSTWNEPTGFTNHSTAKDMCRIMAVASGYEKIHDIWNTASRSIRRILADGSVVDYAADSSVFESGSSALTNYYNVMGGKTGTLNANRADDGLPTYNLVSIVQSKKSPDDWYAIAVMRANTANGGSGDRFIATKEVMDIIESSGESGEEVINPLDTVAWEGMTYRDIFITNNQAPKINENTFASIDGDFTASTGTPTIQEDSTAKDNYVPPYYLDVTGTTSQQLRGPLTTWQNVPVLTACNVNIPAYTQGYCGIIVGQSYNGALNRTTNGFEAHTAVFVATSDNSNSRCFVGSASSANLTGYINNPVLVRQSIFTTVPTEDEWQTLYENYNAKLLEAQGMAASVSAQDVSASHVYAVKLPKHNTRAYRRYALTPVYQKDATTSVMPASTTKILLAMVVLDYVADLYEKITIKQSDKDALLAYGTWGSGLEVGDTLTYLDLLYAALLPSNNVSTQVLARGVGEKILRSRNL